MHKDRCSTGGCLDLHDMGPTFCARALVRLVARWVFLWRMSNNASGSVPSVPAGSIQPNKAYLDEGDDKMKSVKPQYSYVGLISMSIQNSPDRRLTYNGICDYITKNFPYYRNPQNQGWRSTIRHTLSQKTCFKKLPVKGGKNGRSHYWALDPNHEVLFVPAVAIQPNKAYSDEGDDKMNRIKPPYSYVALISMSIQSSPDKRQTLNGICDYITKNFPYYRNRPNQGWRSTIRHHLSLQKCFTKGGKNGRNHYWALDPNHEVLFEEGSYRRKRRLRKVKRISTAEPEAEPTTAAYHSSPYSHVGAGMDSAVLHSHYAASQLVSKASTAADFTTPCHSTGATAVASSPPIYILRPEELSLFGGFLQTSLIFEIKDQQ